MRRIQGGNQLRLTGVRFQRAVAIESLEVRAMLAADCLPDSQTDTDLQANLVGQIGAAQSVDADWLEILHRGPLNWDPGSQEQPRALGLLEGEAVDPPPVLMHFSVVTDPTNFTDPNRGSVEQLPESMLRTHEWDRYFVEVWVESDQEIGDLSIDLNYQTEITTPRAVTFGPAFSSGQQYAWDDDQGELRNLTAQSDSHQGLFGGDHPGEMVLFARIEFGADAQRDNVELDFETGTVGPQSLELKMVRSQAQSPEGASLDVSSAAEPDFGLVPVIYDLDDNQQISLVDLSMLIRNIGSDVDAPNGQASWYADVDKDYIISLMDLSYMIRNLGSDSTTESITFPANYPEAWIADTTVGGGDPGGGDPGDGPTDPGDGEDPPPLRFVPINVDGFRLAPDPDMLLALQAVLQVQFIFPVGFDFSLLSGNVSYSDGDNDGEKETMLQLEVDDQLFETEIEIEIMTELIDSDDLWVDWSDVIGDYFGDVIAGLKDLFLNDDD
ncbi:MAG: hypothetical protein ACIALR_16090 [Blastopirellula sp. JB062]